MAVQSMTGFARASAEQDGASITWELRSVNGKGLEARLRLPPGLERVEQAAKQAIQKRFARGNIQASLAVVRSGSSARPVVNEAFLEEAAALAQRLQARFGCAPATADGLLALRGVLEVPELADDEEARTALDTAILTVLDEALSGLEHARRAEGEALSSILLGQVAAIEALVLRAEADPSRDPGVIRERIGAQVRVLMGAAGAALDESRLHMEAAILATKADIREEIDRLKAHVEAARRMIETGGATGRRLDFLAQEFNRESNTLCSKSNATAVTAIGLELKVVVDQFREQLQNLE
ncbi:YicC/YloC family endoribonuclease [Aquibium sp. ELW1220]|uniref:YicC/YloC family endoribonuclease n=1 Tax=Aquibium sp. ELW1220 TaxID=2976766 RepID=UPI0025B1941E|nr:YicC/YloC family endoribonuclease [Aquibium sp. ELW1220]MDN2583069.1 YicC family protein [Aquibium sp. ELW1220]